MKDAAELMNEDIEDDGGEIEKIELTPKEKRLKAIDMIETGESTKDDLLEALGVTKQQLGKVMGELRILDKYGVEIEGKMVFVSEEAWNESKKSTTTTGPSKPKVSKTKPSKRLAQAVSSQKRKLELLDTATARAAKSNSYLDRLKLERAKIDLTIANLTLTKVRETIAGELSTTMDVVCEPENYGALDENWKTVTHEPPAEPEVAQG